MTTPTDDTGGRAQQGTDDLIGGEDLGRANKADRTSRQASDRIGRAKDWVEDKIDGVRDRIG